MAEELFNGNIASEMNLEEAVNKGILPEATYVSALYGYGEQLNRMQQDINRIQEPTRRQEAQNLFQKLQGRLNEETQHLPELLSEHMTNKNGKYIVFCKNVEDMQQRMQAVQEVFGGVNPNITTYSVYASKGIMANEKMLKAFEKADDDSLKLMFAVDMLNEGYHVNDLDGIIMMRPTFSPTIFVQQLGRALTIKNEGTNPPVILDLVNNFDSCKIIEDFCERMKQAERGEKEQDDKSAPRGRIAIFDKTKEFREIASRVTELCKRVVTLDEKIEIFKRFSQTGEELTGNTVFEGYPIGSWGILIRSEVNNDRLNLTDKQFEALNKMGILDRQIDSTIDEKIEAAINWCAKYPKAKIVGQVNPQDVLQEYAKNNEEFQKLQEQYERIRTYYDYIRARKSQGKLTEEQVKACKEGNLGGVFGFPSKTEELAKFYRIQPKKIDYILSKYGSMEEFINAYMESDDLQFEASGPLKDNIRPDFGFDISGNPDSCKIMPDLIRKKRNIIYLYDFEKVLDDTDVVLNLYGIYGEKKLSMRDTGLKLQINASELKRLKEDSLGRMRARFRRTFQYTASKENLSERLLPEEIEYLNDVYEKIRGSNLIFYPDKECEREPESIDINELKKFYDEMNIITGKETEREINEKRRIEEQAKEELYDKLGLSTRTYNCLRGAKISTIAELKKMSEEELMQVRNLGGKGLDEIITKLKLIDKTYEGPIDDIDYDYDYFDWEFFRENDSEQDLGESVETVEPTTQETQDEQTTEANNGEANSKNEPTELEKAKLEREEVAQALAKLKEQVMSAEQLLAQYDELLGNKKQMGRTPGSEGE